MEVGFFTHPLFLEHDTGPGHPESPRRLEAILRMLDGEPFAGRLVRVDDFPRRAPASLYGVHDRQYVESVRQRIEAGATVLDFGDTRVCPASYDAALKAADAAADAALRVWSGELTRAFVATRPPGHHAERAGAMGFCIFNNIAVAASQLLEAGAARVAIVDWDVHHGNGTQAAFYAEPRVLYVSLHQFPHYPGTGSAGERGVGEAEGTTLNIPMPAGSGDEEYLEAFEEQVVPAVDQFAPEAILVSAGFDAHADDPLAGMRLSTEAYAEMTRRLRLAAGRHCDGRIVSFLEGGYNLVALCEALGAHLLELLEK